MGRIRDAYESRFRKLLGRLQPRRLELGVQMLLSRAERLSVRDQITLPDALERVYERTRQQIERRHGDREQSPSGPVEGESNAVERPVFACDAGLGGLARWLRAAGFETHWWPDIDDDELIREAREIPATLLTTDSLLMERGVLRDGLIPSLWVPPSLTKIGQLKLVLRELGLEIGTPRCMTCGGVLNRVEKDQVRDRIPPKTWRWRDEYFLCARCGKLFWHGSHWEGIGKRLADLKSQS